MFKSNDSSYGHYNMIHPLNCSPRNAPKILFTDLDGTLLNSQRTISDENRQALNRLRDNEIVRVIATGRSLYSFSKVLPDNPPADFLIFSSGAGIIDLSTRELLYSSNLQSDEVALITERLIAQRVDFMVHHEVPQNHHFAYHTADGNNDFSRRVAAYRKFALPFDADTFTPGPAAQVIAVLPYNPARFNIISKQLPEFQVTRTTSPLDHTSMWMEIGPDGTHKGSSAKWLCRYLGIDDSETVAIGNDYNDIDLLDFCNTAFLVANGPTELQKTYSPAPCNDDHGFSKAVQQAFF